MTRRVWLGVGVFVLAACVLLVLFAHPRWPSALLSGDNTRAAATDWVGSGSTVTPDGDALDVVSDGGTAMVVRDGLALPASQYRYLHYRATGIAADARLLLLWRNGGEMQRRLLPRVAGVGAIDLAASAEWQGDIGMLALAVIPIDYLPAEAVQGQAFRLERVELRADNAWSAVVAQLTDWLAPRAWTGASINTAGGEYGPRGASLTAFLACLVLLGAGVVRIVGGGAALRCALPALLLGGVGMLVLDQGVDLLGRTRAVAAASARVYSAPPLQLAADPALAQDVAALRAALGDTRGRIVVYAQSTFQRDYAVYLLRDADVGALSDVRGFGTRATLDGVLFVVVDDGPDTFDAATGTVRVGGQARVATPVWDGKRLRAFRLGRGATP